MIKMNKKNSPQNILLILLLLTFPLSLFARTGNEIVATGQSYLTYSWTCGTQNAREVNRDTDPNNNDLDHPFFPTGAAYLDPITNEEIFEDDGGYTGVAYAWGLTDNTSDFGAGLSVGKQAGSRQVWSPSIYTGIDCSGFAGRCTGINFMKVGCGHLMTTNLTNSIDWTEVVRGDILIKNSHVAVVTGKTGDLASVIESAWHYDATNSLQGMRVMSNTYSRTGGIIYRDHDPEGSQGYEPRRFSPPILKKITIKLEGPGKILYQADWTEDAANRTLTKTPDNEIIPAKAGDVILFEIEFSKAMDNSFGIVATFGLSSPYNQNTIPPLSNGCGGWESPITYDQTIVYKKWIGRFVVPDNSSYDGTLHISINAKSVTDCQLDADPENIAKRTASGGWQDYTSAPDTQHEFKIGAPADNDFTVTCTPPSQSIKNGKTASHTITIKNLDPINSSTFDITIEGTAPGWNVSPDSFSNIVVLSNGSNSVSFSATNNNASAPLILTINVTHKESGITKSPENLDNAENPGHVTDHPDDNFSVSSPEYPTAWLYNSDSPIGVLASGWGEGLHYLLGKYNVATCVVKQDLTILNEPGKPLSDLDILLIGSAALSGLESSPTFRKNIANFVNQGGRLISLTAKNGYEFNALPGGQVSGYGWEEDQSCLNSAVSIVKYHQMLSDNVLI